jgi:phosphatidylinositol-3-phosphatase
MRVTRRTALTALFVVVLSVVGVAVVVSVRGRPQAAEATPPASVAPSKVLVVFEENHSLSEVRAGMPYLSGLAERYGSATAWTAVARPSLPNYLAIAGGTTFGVLDDLPPSSHRPEVGAHLSVFAQALNAGRTAKVYAESMPTRCDPDDHPARGVSGPHYAVRHNPWVYFTYSRGACRAYDVPMSPSFGRDVRANTLPDVGFLVPNLCHEAVTCSLRTADAWLERRLGPVLAGEDFRSGALVVVVTTDEDALRPAGDSTRGPATGGDAVFTAVLTPWLSHTVVATPLTHYSLTRYVDDVLGVPPLRQAGTAPDLRVAFGLPATR